MGVKSSRPTITHDLLYSERTFLDAMHSLRYGRFESLRTERGELVVDPWPKTIRHVRFGASDPGCEKEPSTEFRLKAQLAELFEYVRSVDAGEIRILEIRRGVHFSMEVQVAGRTTAAEGGRRG
jgi:hypothetical protein